MTELEKQIARAMKELLEESESACVSEPETEIISETVEKRQKKRDTQSIRESRKIFRRWRKQAGF